MIIEYIGKSKAVYRFSMTQLHWCKSVNIWSLGVAKDVVMSVFCVCFLASPCLGTTRVHSFTSAEEQKTSCFDHENCLSRAKEKPRREDEESVKSRAVSDIWNSHIGDLRWAQPLQDQQGDRRILIPLDFMGGNLVACKACRLQRSPLFSSLATAGPLWTGRVETGRTSTICKCNKRANIDINSCHCCLCR